MDAKCERHLNVTRAARSADKDHRAAFEGGVRQNGKEFIEACEDAVCRENGDMTRRE